MPEFQMPNEGRVQIIDAPFTGATLAFDNLDSFTQGYIEAMFFTDCTSDNEELEDATFGDMAPDTLRQAITECETFQTANAALLDLAYDRGDYSDTQAGRDFWFTRNGHGVGFWDRQQLDQDKLGDKLSNACKAGFSGRDSYRGDDGKVYLS